MHTPHKWQHFILAAALTLSGGMSQADDTEIYVGDASIAEGVIFPNVLFLLDTSSSMTNTDGTGITRLDRMKEAMRQIISTSNNVNMGMARFHREGGPILFPVSNIHAEVGTVESSENGSDITVSLAASTDDAEEDSSGIVTLDSETLEMINKPAETGSGELAIDVAHSADDAEEVVSSGHMNRSSTDLELMHEGSTQQAVGIRFLNVDIPAGSVVNSASIRFERDESTGWNTPVTIAITGEQNVNPARFSSNSGDITGRAQTDAVVNWAAGSTLDANGYFETDDLSAIVSEIIGLDGWTAGNPMVFRFDHVSGSGKRIAASYNDAQDEPRLQISYSAAGGDVDQTVGLRFQRLMIPQGATITSAHIEFEAAQSGSDSASLTVHAQDADDAPTFSADTGDISGRSATSASVSWPSIPPWTSGQRYQTPDLTSVVQEVVDRTNWCGGNAMAFLITGETASRRVANAFDGDTSAVPVLSISYDPDSVSDDACINQMFQAQVVSGSDDAEERSDNSMYMDSSDLELVEDGGAQTVGVRFRNVKIPKDTTITYAELVFATDETDSGAASLTIEGEAADDSAAFGTASGDLSNRSTTSASTSWSPASWDTVGETHATPDISGIVQEIVNRSGWESGNAMSFLITGSGTRTAEAYDGDASAAPMLRVYVQGALGTGYQTVRDRLLEIVDGLNWKSGTPILDSLYETAHYFRGESVHYGKTRGFGHTLNDGSAGESSRSRCEHTRLSHPGSYTGGTVVRPAGCSEDTPNSTACIDEYISGSPVYVTPITEHCQANYQILLSDGNGYGTQSVSLVNSILESGYSCSNHDNCSVELVKYLYNEDQLDDLNNDQTVTTYTIGFNLDSTSPDFLTDVANAGGGSFHTADTAAELSEVFQAILADILSRSTSFTAPAVSVNAFNKLFHDNEVYFSVFMPTRSVRWNGNLKKYTLCAGEDGDTCTRGDVLDASSPPKPALGSNNRFRDDAKSYWSLSTDGGDVTSGGAGEEIPSADSRVLYTYTGSAAPSNVNLGTNDYTISSADGTANASDPLRVALGAASLSDTEYSGLIDWMLGMDVLDEDEDGANNDDRWRFADPLHSRPLVITYGKEGGGTAVKKIFIGTNDGALRMINSDTGVEEWAFIPAAMLDRQRQFKTNANGDHLYGMDGDITAWVNDADEDGVIEPASDKVVIFAGMRRGGRNIYALDVTPGATLADADATGGITPRLLWRIEGGVSTGFGQLGQTWSAPSVTKIPYGSSYKNVLLFGGGYEAGQDSGFATASVGNAIYAVDITDGSLVFSVSNTGSGATKELAGMDYPIPSDLALMDSDGDQLTDRIYVGDTGGQMWRLDIARSGGSVAVTGARLAIVGSDADDADKRKFFYPPDVAQLYDEENSNTAEYDLVTIISGNRAHPTDNVVHDRVYGFRDVAIGGPIAEDFTPLSTANDLYDATDNLIQQGSAEQKEAALDTLKAKKGWYFDLNEADGSWIGEKGLSPPIILDNKMFFTTYLPDATVANNNDPCGSPVEGSGRLYAVDIRNAVAVYPNWDGQGESSVYTRADRDYDLWAGIPSAVVPVFQPKGITLIVGGGGGGGTFDPNIELPIIRTFWFQER